MLLMSISVMDPLHLPGSMVLRLMQGGEGAQSQLRRVCEGGGLAREESMEEDINLHHYS